MPPRITRGGHGGGGVASPATANAVASQPPPPPPPQSSSYPLPPPTSGCSGETSYMNAPPPMPVTPHQQSVGADAMNMHHYQPPPPPPPQLSHLHASHAGGGFYGGAGGGGGNNSGGGGYNDRNHIYGNNANSGGSSHHSNNANNNSGGFGNTGGAGNSVNPMLNIEVGGDMSMGGMNSMNNMNMNNNNNNWMRQPPTQGMNYPQSPPKMYQQGGYMQNNSNNAGSGNANNNNSYGNNSNNSHMGNTGSNYPSVHRNNYMQPPPPTPQPPIPPNIPGANPMAGYGASMPNPGNMGSNNSNDHMNIGGMMPGGNNNNSSNNNSNMMMMPPPPPPQQQQQQPLPSPYAQQNSANLRHRTPAPTGGNGGFNTNNNNNNNSNNASVTGGGAPHHTLQQHSQQQPPPPLPPPPHSVYNNPNNMYGMTPNMTSYGGGNNNSNNNNSMTNNNNNNMNNNNSNNNNNNNVSIATSPVINNSISNPVRLGSQTNSSSSNNKSNSTPSLRYSANNMPLPTNMEANGSFAGSTNAAISSGTPAQLPPPPPPPPQSPPQYSQQQSQQQQQPPPLSQRDNSFYGDTTNSPGTHSQQGTVQVGGAGMNNSMHSNSNNNSTTGTASRPPQPHQSPLSGVGGYGAPICSPLKQQQHHRQGNNNNNNSNNNAMMMSNVGANSRHYDGMNSYSGNNNNNNNADNSTNYMMHNNNNNNNNSMTAASLGANMSLHSGVGGGEMGSTTSMYPNHPMSANVSVSGNPVLTPSHYGSINGGNAPGGGGLASVSNNSMGGTNALSSASMMNSPQLGGISGDAGGGMNRITTAAAGATPHITPAVPAGLAATTSPMTMGGAPGGGASMPNPMTGGAGPYGGGGGPNSSMTNNNNDNSMGSMNGGDWQYNYPMNPNNSAHNNNMSSNNNSMISNSNSNNMMMGGGASSNSFPGAPMIPSHIPSPMNHMSRSSNNNNNNNSRGYHNRNNNMNNSNNNNNNTNSSGPMNMNTNMMGGGGGGNRMGGVHNNSSNNNNSGAMHPGQMSMPMSSCMSPAPHMPPSQPPPHSASHTPSYGQHPSMQLPHTRLPHHPLSHLQQQHQQPPPHSMPPPPPHHASMPHSGGMSNTVSPHHSHNMTGPQMYPPPGSSVPMMPNATIHAALSPPSDSCATSMLTPSSQSNNYLHGSAQHGVGTNSHANTNHSGHLGSGHMNTSHHHPPHHGSGSGSTGYPIMPALSHDGNASMNPAAVSNDRGLMPHDMGDGRFNFAGKSGAGAGAGADTMSGGGYIPHDMREMLFDFLKRKHLLHTGSLDKFIKTSTYHDNSNNNNNNNRSISSSGSSSAAGTASAYAAAQGNNKPVFVALDGNYMLSNLREKLHDCDPLWFLHSWLPDHLLTLVRESVTAMRRRDLEPIWVFNGIGVSGDVEAFVPSEEELMARQYVWHKLTEGDLPTREELLKAFETPPSIGEDVLMNIQRFLRNELHVMAVAAPFLNWCQIATFHKEGLAQLMMGPPEMLMIPYLPMRLLVEMDPVSGKVTYFDRTEVLQKLFPCQCNVFGIDAASDRFLDFGLLIASHPAITAACADTTLTTQQVYDELSAEKPRFESIRQFIGFYEVDQLDHNRRGSEALKHAKGRSYIQCSAVFSSQFQDSPVYFRRVLNPSLRNSNMPNNLSGVFGNLVPLSLFYFQFVGLLSVSLMTILTQCYFRDELPVSDSQDYHMHLIVLSKLRGLIVYQIIQKIKSETYRSHINSISWVRWYENVLASFEPPPTIIKLDEWRISESLDIERANKLQLHEINIATVFTLNASATCTPANDIESAPDDPHHTPILYHGKKETLIAIILKAFDFLGYFAHTMSNDESDGVCEEVDGRQDALSTTSSTPMQPRNDRNNNNNNSNNNHANPSTHTDGTGPDVAQENSDEGGDVLGQPRRAGSHASAQEEEKSSMEEHGDYSASDDEKGGAKNIFCTHYLTPLLERYPVKFHSAFICLTELVRSNIINAVPCRYIVPKGSTPDAGGFIRNDANEAPEVLLATRIACLVSIPYNSCNGNEPFAWAPVYSRHLSAFNVMVRGMNREIRELLEVVAANVFLSGHSDCKLEEYADLIELLPFGEVTSSIGGLLLHYVLVFPADYENSCNTPRERCDHLQNKFKAIPDISTQLRTVMEFTFHSLYLLEMYCRDIPKEVLAESIRETNVVAETLDLLREKWTLHLDDQPPVNIHDSPSAPLNE